MRCDGQRRGSRGVAGSSGIDTTPDLGDVDGGGIRYVAISRISETINQMEIRPNRKKDSSEPFSDSTSALLVVDLVRFRTWLGVRGAADGRA